MKREILSALALLLALLALSSEQASAAPPGRPAVAPAACRVPREATGDAAARLGRVLAVTPAPADRTQPPPVLSRVCPCLPGRSNCDCPACIVVRGPVTARAHNPKRAYLGISPYEWGVMEIRADGTLAFAVDKGFATKAEAEAHCKTCPEETKAASFPRRPVRLERRLGRCR